jgi:predicted RNA binding protein YcfA (HicA-like mRNA interferase family)
MTGKELVATLKKEGWKLEHVRGSHHVMHKDGKTISIPVHAGKDIGRGLLNKLLKQAGLK